MEVSAHAVPQIVLEVTDPTHAGEARRSAVRCAERLGLGESDQGAVGIVITEMTSNVIKHAGTGKLVLQPVAQNGTRGLRALAMDKGPGIRNMSEALEDGHSTAGTPGNGLGAIQRLSTYFDIYSAPDRGTCVLADFWPKGKLPKIADRLQVGAISIPVRGEAVCGDGWAIKKSANWVLLMLVDGLGHGVHAAEAAREAEHVLAEAQSESPASILLDSHDALKKTRGAALAIAAVDCDGEKLSFAGLGNISAVITEPQSSRGMPSHNGTAGHQMRKIQEFSFPWHRNSLLIMHSDGIMGRWNLQNYPGLQNRDASIIAAVIYRDFVRERDDATVLVAKPVERESTL
jgi:anti-sigma regulatory factor (Ser/Thr protein kinase)